MSTELATLQNYLKNLLLSDNLSSMASLVNIPSLFHSKIVEFIDRRIPQLCSGIEEGELKFLQTFFEMQYPNHVFNWAPLILYDIKNKKNKEQYYQDHRYYHRLSNFWNNMDVAIEDYHIECRLVHMQHEESGKNKPKKFFFPASSVSSVHYALKQKILTLNFEYKINSLEYKNNSSTETQKAINSKFYTEILKKIKDEKLFNLLTEKTGNSNIDLLTLILSKYTTPRHTDCYINKQILPFLHQQFHDFFQLYHINTEISQSKKIKSLAEEIFVILDKIENIKQKLYEKKPFIYNSGYCVSLEKISSTQYEVIQQNSSQKAAWDKSVRLELQNNPENTIIDQSFFVNRGPYLMVDTRFYPALWKETLLSHFNNLEDEIDGLAVNSENWQALNLLNSRFANLIKCIYIDPPYNTGNQDFIYDDKLNRDIWLQMMSDRLNLAQKMLHQEGIFFSSIDDNELAIYSLLVEQIFRYRLDNIIWHKKTQPSYLSKELIPVTEYIIVAKKTSNSIPMMGSFGDLNKLTEMINIGNPICDRILPKNAVIIANGWSGVLENGKYGKDKLQVEVLNGPIIVQEGKPEKNLHLRSRFKWQQQRIDEEVEKGGVIHIKTIKSLRPTIARQYDEPIIRAPTTLLSKKVNDAPTNTDANAEMKDLFGISPFDYSKPTDLIKFLVNAATYFSNEEWVLDFFAGSGTLAQAAIELNAQDGGKRRYVVIEQEQYFESVLKTRIQRICYSQEWSDGRPVGEWGHSHFFQYFSLEQYEDRVRNIRLSPSLIPKRIEYLIDWDDCSCPIKICPEKFDSPYGYMLNVTIHGILQFIEVDLIETFNFLLGLHVQRRYSINHQKRDYIIIYGTAGTQKILIIWRDLQNLDTTEENTFLSEYIYQNHSYNIVFKNGDNLEKKFIQLMFNDI